MTVEPVEVNGETQSVPVVDQSEYIRKLEERLIALEKRMITMDLEGAKEETPRPDTPVGDEEEKGEEEESSEAKGESQEEDEKSDEKDDEDEEEKHEDGNKQPASPPIVPEIQKQNYMQHYHRFMTAPGIPAIEVLLTTLSDEEERAKLDTFRKSLSGVSPAETLEMIRNAQKEPCKLEIGKDCWQIRINSSPLAQLLFPLLCGQSLEADKAILFHRSFRVPVHYHDEVRKKLAEMEAEYESNKTDASANDEGKTETKMELLAELRLYVQWMDQDIMGFYSRFKEMSATDNCKVTFYDLWHFFQPGDTIYVPDAKDVASRGDYAKLKRSKRPDQKLWRVYTRYEAGADEFFWVKAYCIDHDGDSLICVKEWFRIDFFEGETSVTSLKVYPIRFASNASKIMEEATKSGRGFQDMLATKLFSHNGWTFEPEQDESSLRYVSGDVVIDFAETFKAHPDWKPVAKLPSAHYTGSRGEASSRDSLLTSYWVDREKLHEVKSQLVVWDEKQVPRLEKIDYCRKKDGFLSSLLVTDSPKYELKEEDFHLLPQRLFGYSLQDRKFVGINISNMKHIEEGADKFRNLVINPAHESMLRALVESHFRRKEIHNTTGLYATNQDIIQNKGRGLVILLHGVPGVGKTSTAETIASDFKKPLLPITCGDLGLDPAAVERSLKQMFRVAQLWDCILLLDEADVFLAERVSSDLSRNALVSVFLRVLDYYSGILFLTTNRVGRIDEAFKSRIHISLYYPHLELNQTEQIWQVNLSRLAAIEMEQSKSQTPLTIDNQGIMTFATKHFTKRKDGKGRWNGRQIRNAFLIASALARYEKSHGIRIDANPCDLNARHFKTVVKAGIGFEKYLLETKGKTDQEAAYLSGTRADHIQSPDVQDAPRAAAQKPIQPAIPPVNPGWTQQFPTATTQPHTPTRTQAVYNPPHLSPGTGIYGQQPQQHYIIESGNAANTFGQPQVTALYAQPRPVTPVVQAPAYGQAVGMQNFDYDSD